MGYMVHNTLVLHWTKEHFNPPPLVLKAIGTSVALPIAWVCLSRHWDGFPYVWDWLWKMSLLNIHIHPPHYFLVVTKWFAFVYNSLPACNSYSVHACVRVHVRTVGSPFGGGNPTIIPQLLLQWLLTRTVTYGPKIERWLPLYKM